MKENIQNKQIALKIGTSHSWPILRIGIHPPDEQTINFYALRFGKPDWRTIDHSLKQANDHLSRTGKPAEIIQYKTFKSLLRLYSSTAWLRVVCLCLSSPRRRGSSL